MARPSKEEKKEREVLLRYFKRDSRIYSIFEENTDGMNKDKVLNLLLDASSTRYIFEKNYYIRKEIGDGIGCSNDNFPPHQEIYFEELYRLNKYKHDYYSLLMCISKHRWDGYKPSEIIGRYVQDDINGKCLEYGCENHYSNHFTIDSGRLIEIFGLERAKELGASYYPIYFSHFKFKLTDNEKKILVNSISKESHGVKTIVKRSHGYYGGQGSSNNTYLVDIDFTRPLEEIKEHIEFLYNEYQDNKLPNVFDFLGIERKRSNHEEHYKTNSHKPFNVLLADKLFIYDARKMGLSWGDIQTELNHYTNKVLKISADKITEDTAKKYFKYMTNFIDERSFLNYQNGFDY